MLSYPVLILIPFFSRSSVLFLTEFCSFGFARSYCFFFVMERKQQSSLLNFFAKSPRSANTKTSSSRSNVGTESNDNNNKVKGTNKNEDNGRVKNNNGASPASKRPKTSEPELVPGDLVWSRLEGYPWWPSMVCSDPATKTHSRLGGVHVQFFDSVSSHSWVKRDKTAPFVGRGECEIGGKFYCRDPELRKGASDAEEAGTVEDRSERLRRFLAALHEEEAGEEEEEEDGGEDGEKENRDSVDTKPETAKKRRREVPTTAKEENKSKRRRIVTPLNSSDEDDDDKEELQESEDEFKPSKKEESSSSDNEEVVGDEEESEPTSSDESLEAIKDRYKKKSSSGKGNRKKTGPVTPKSAPLPPTPKTPKTAAIFSSSAASSPKPVSAAIKSKLAQFEAPDEGDQGGLARPEGGVFKHQTYEFLKPEKIRDAARRRPDDPDYDPRTLHVPAEFLNKETPAQRQWWEFKAKNFDVILFFKQGKFYELYHMDCVTGVKECGLQYMRGEHAHCGFPEKAGPRYAEALIQKGYAVARIEQTETPAMMEARVKEMARPTKFDKVVRREICAIATKATRTFGYMDKEASEPGASFLTALIEKETQDEEGRPRWNYGVCFVDAAIGKFVVGQFVDDRHASRLRALLAHWPPTQILRGKGDKMLTPKTANLLKSSCPSAIFETPLNPGAEFWEAEKTLKVLAEGEYFVEESSKEFAWPEGLKTILSDTDSLGLTAKPDYELAVRALGAVVWYLTKCVVDHELLSMKLFEVYQPIDVADGDRAIALEDEYIRGRKYMILDGVTTNNLDVLNVDGGLEGSLLEKIDHTSTPFGKRLLREWLTSPLCDLEAIKNRQDAVDDLAANPSFLEEIGSLLKKLPDLERLLSRVHSMGSGQRNAKHPDGRAIIFEEEIFNKRKIEDFLKIIEGYKTSVEIVKTFKKENLRCSRLKDLTTFETDGGKYPDVAEELDNFFQMFDHKKAQAQGAIIPADGMDPEYDAALKEIADAKKALVDYQREKKKSLGCVVNFFHQAKNTYQLEIPDNKHVSDDYRIVSSRKGFKRYYTEDLLELRDALNETEQRRDQLRRDTARRVFHKFDENAASWTKACRVLATLDALISLAKYSASGSGDMVRPEFVLSSATEGTKPFIEIRDGVHPTITSTFSGDDFIPNDTLIGVAEDGSCGAASMVLVTGPNMGGKSTLMRQVASLVILAQMGCRVPASKCRLTPVDRIFTRLGARDNIVGGESTFFVELSETAAILRHATPHSLVLLDELGRGTATFDGTAIASAVVKELVEAKRCRTLFSTHYHLLVDSYVHSPGIELGHMACMVENQNEEDPTQESITFLYKFVAGNCPKSYGFNTAKLAGLPDAVVKTAAQKAKELERGVHRAKAIRGMLNDNVTKEELKNWLVAFC